MVITQTARGNAGILLLSGRFDFHARHDFQEAVQKAQDSDARLIVLHMKDVSFIDSAALGLITVTYKNLETAKVRLVVAELQDYVQKIFSLANLGAIISIFPSVDEAVASRAPVASPVIR